VVGQNRLILGLTFAVLTGHVVALRANDPLPVETRKPWVPELKVEKYQLPNGLTVILHEDHKTPLVAVNVIYNVGSKNDPPGRSGFGHLFEHRMFEGSQHSDWSYFGPIYRYYSTVQGTTGSDRTVYGATVTDNALELVLWLEADRMGFLLPSVTERKLKNVRNIELATISVTEIPIPTFATRGIEIGAARPVFRTGVTRSLYSRTTIHHIDKSRPFSLKNVISGKGTSHATVRGRNDVAYHDCLCRG